MKSYIIKKSKIHGDGLFANKNFKKRDLILSIDLSNFPAYSLEEWKNIPGDSNHMDYVGRGKYVITYHPYSYINHSCDPNIIVKHLSISKSEFYASKDIKKGEQLTYDYGVNAMDQIDKGSWKVKCNCGSTNCRKILSSCFLKQPLKIQKKYYNYLPPSIKKKYKDKFSKLKNRKFDSF